MEQECRDVKIQHENKLSIVEIRMLRWMCRETRRDNIRNGREGVGVATVVEKMVEARLR